MTLHPAGPIRFDGFSLPFPTLALPPRRSSIPRLFDDFPVGGLTPPSTTKLRPPPNVTERPLLTWSLTPRHNVIYPGLLPRKSSRLLPFRFHLSPAAPFSVFPLPLRVKSAVFRPPSSFLRPRRQLPNKSCDQGFSSMTVYLVR